MSSEGKENHMPGGLDIRLTEYSIFGGCGCKVPNHILSGIIKDIKLSDNGNVIADFRHNEDSAIVKINDTQCLVYSLDFFTPIVDDPEIFGRIAAANAISDIFAKGAQPYIALSILGFPKELEATDVPYKIMQGVSRLCDELNIHLLGGHTIYNPQVFCGLSVIGTADLRQIKLNKTAKTGDLIYLTKPLGSGILSTALRQGALTPEEQEAMIAFLAQPNKLGAVLGDHSFVNSMTDITGFGLLGHLIELCKASNVSAEISFDKIKTLPFLDEYLKMGIVTSGGQANWKNYCRHVNDLEKGQDILLADPQSNGGLLITVDPGHRNEFEQILTHHGLADFIEPIGVITPRKEPTLEVVCDSR